MLPLLKNLRSADTVAYAATALVLLALLGDRALLRMAPAETDAYHAAVRSAVNAIPRVTGDWVGVDVSVPDAAVQMLHPNVILSRRYQNLSTNEAVVVLLVHVRDARDVIGHYPPVCYPGQGWKTRSATPQDWRAGTLQMAGVEYDFVQERLEGALQLYVGNSLIFAGGETCRDMDGVERAAQDRKRKFFGAGQVQFVHGDRTTPVRRRQIVEEFLQSLEPALRAIVARDGGDSGSGGTT